MYTESPRWRAQQPENRGALPSADACSRSTSGSRDQPWRPIHNKRQSPTTRNANVSKHRRHHRRSRPPDQRSHAWSASFAGAKERGRSTMLGRRTLPCIRRVHA